MKRQAGVRSMADILNKILIATGNLNKLLEIKEKTAGITVEFLGLKDLDSMPEIEETGATFRENAVLKAAGYARLSGLYSLADDSGLEVVALNGRPGVLSSRYAGEGVGYDEKMRLLLEELADSASQDRSARFVCSLALCAPNGEMLFETKGICSGTIAFEPRGNRGFGYDPVFIPEGHSQTFGELLPTVKHKISHRAQAIKQFILFLRASAVI